MSADCPPKPPMGWWMRMRLFGSARRSAGLLERTPGSGREVRYRLRGEALAPAADWLRSAETAWEQRLARLKGALESGA